jgi:hypothetical protein
MKNPVFDPSQIRLPVFDDLYGQPAQPIKYCPRKLSRRREHAGAPALGIDYGFDYGEASERDQQGYESVRPSPVPVVFFDFDEVYRHLDGDRDEDARAAILKLAAEALSAMSLWLQEEFVSPDSGVRWRLETATRCKLALLALYSHPEVLGNPTLEQLANRLGISKQKLDLLWREFKQRFPGVVAPWEKSEVAKEAYRQAHRQGDRSHELL